MRVAAPHRCERVVGNVDLDEAVRDVRCAHGCNELKRYCEGRRIHRRILRSVRFDESQTERHVFALLRLRLDERVQLEMDLVFIHGPPASGKLTVAKELAKITKYRLCHNHLSNDLVSSVLDFGKGSFWEIVRDIRLQILEAAAKNKTEGVIVTYCYSQGEDEKDIQRYMARLKKYRVRFLFVHLHCDPQELLRRVKEPSRQKYKKIQRTTTLKALLKKKEFFTPIRHDSTISIDNTNRSPKTVARKIKKAFQL